MSDLEQQVSQATSNTEAVENSEMAEGSYQPGYTPADTTDRKASFEKLIPDTYKEKFFIKNALKTENPLETILQGYDNIEKMLGQRQQVQFPTAETPPEQRKAFYAQLGVPETIEGYKVQAQQWDDNDKQIGEFLTKAHNEPFMKDMMQIFHGAELTNEQVNKIVNGYDRLFITHFRNDVAAMAQQAEASDAEFTEMSQQMFGDTAGQVMDIGNKMLKQFVPENIRPLIPELDNKSLMVLSGVLMNIHKQFMSEDNISIPTGSGVKSRADLIAEAEALMQRPEYSQSRYGAQHEALVKKVNDIFANLPPK